MTDARAAALARRVAASKKGAASAKRLRQFMETGKPIEAMPARGAARGDYRPSELLQRIRAAGETA